MICPNCTKEILGNSAFCPDCGTKFNVEAQTEHNVTTPTPTQSDTTSTNAIDLRGNVSDTAPLEKKYKPLLWASILCIPVLIVMIIAGILFHTYVMEFSREMLFMGLLIVEIPFFLFSIPFYLHAKVKHKRSGSKRKMAKGTTPLLYIITILTVSLAMVRGFAGAFSTAGLLPTFSTIIFIIMAILLVIYCNAVSQQNGTEAYLCFAKALMLACLLAAPVGFVLGMILRLLERALIIIIILGIVFLLFGGRIIFIRRN